MRKISFTFLLLAVLALPAAAQESRGSILGRVTDVHGCVDSGCESVGG